MYSPDYVSISLASAIGLRLRSGRFYRDARATCANLLLAYPPTCLANCAYCGLARERPGLTGEKSFIRVEWPVVPTDEVVERLERYGGEVRRVCLSMVTHGRAYADTMRISERLARLPAPLSVLIAPNLFDRSRLEELRAAGADMVGIGLDAASERVFEERRGRSAGGPLSGTQYWQAIEEAAGVFGPWKVNAHLVAGLGETDREMIQTIGRLRALRVNAYLFAFYPEAGSRMARSPRPPLVRWRRLQLAKHLLERDVVAPDQIRYDDTGRIAAVDTDAARLEAAVASGRPFMTDGCPGQDGELACNRPFGSYRPGEPFRDFPFAPDAADIASIRRELRLEELLPTRTTAGATA